MWRLAAAVGVFGAMGLGAADAQDVRLTPVATGFNNPVGIDHHPPSGKLLLSVNFPSGLPHNFELVGPDGSHTRFSDISGLTDELKIAAVREGPCQGGFTTGEVFTGTGVPGVIARIAPDGSSVQNPWITLPGETGLLRGSLFQDRYCAFGGDLLVVTTAGNAWRVSSAGAATLLTSLGTHLEGLTTVPNDAAKYGPWAGRALAGAEDQARIYAIGPDGAVDFYELGIQPEDIDLIPAGENFYGVDFGGATLWGAPPDQFTDKVGDVLISQEFPGILWHVRWNGSAFEATEVARVTQWEHMTFSPAGVPPIPPVGAGCEGQEVAPGSAAGLGWRMDYEISDDDGLVLRNVTLANRLMAPMISIPYYTLTTNRMGRQRFELRPSCTAAPNEAGRSRLVGFTKSETPDKVLLEAHYRIDNLPGAPTSTLDITQHYEFRPVKPEGNCEPHLEIPLHDPTVFPCSPYKLTVTYQFNGGGGETVTDINIPQRIHFKPDGRARGTGTFFRDRDNSDFPGPIAGGVVDAFEQVKAEGAFEGVHRGQASTWDNYHQTFKTEVQPPGGGIGGIRPGQPKAGCPECAHVHWRWSDAVGNPEFGNGKPLIPRKDVRFDGLQFDYDSDQDLELAVVLWQPGEEDPADFHDLFDQAVGHDDVVFWYSSTGHRDNDSFWIHFGFFSADFVDLAVSITDAPDPAPAGFDVTYQLTVTNNGPGDATDVRLHLTGLGGVAFLVSGSDRRCVQIGPEVLCTVDRVRAGRSESLTLVVRPTESFEGTFTVTAIFDGAHQVDADDSNDRATATTLFKRPVDLAVSGTGSPDPVRVGQDLVYRIVVNNRRPRLGQWVGARVVDQLPTDVTLVSVSARSASCVTAAATVACDLQLFENLPSEVAIVVRPSAPGRLVNSVTVTPVDAVDLDPSNDTFEIGTSVRR
jgi:hypothetical protein